MTDFPSFDVCVIGAGLAGIVCAKQLEKEGLKVVILEKSRGVGGRMATRRLHTSLVNHGIPYLEVQGRFTEELIKDLLDQQIIELKQGALYKLAISTRELESLPNLKQYIAPEGMTSIAKYLAKNLDIRFSCLVTGVQATQKGTWQIMTENLVITARALIIAIPAPQIVELLKTLADLPLDYLNQLRAIKFEPDLTVMAGYRDFPSLPWQFLQVTGDLHLARISRQSSPNVIVLHSTSELAKSYLDKDFKATGEHLLQSASRILSLPLTEPDWLEVHRWRYAFPSVALNVPYLEITSPGPLICCGDWSGLSGLESALNSGTKAAEKLLGNGFFS